MVLFSDVTFSTEGLVIIGALLTALVGAIGIVFRLLQSSHDARIRDKDDQIRSYRGIAVEAVAVAESYVNVARIAKGKPPTTILAPVIPEHNSPPTDAQQATADLASLRARLTKAVLDSELPPRTAGYPIPGPEATTGGEA